MRRGIAHDRLVGRSRRKVEVVRWRDKNDFFSKIKLLTVEIGATIIFVYFVAKEVWHTLAR